MKILMVLTFALCALFGDGEELYKTKCAVCHGPKAERIYMNKIRPIGKIDSKERLEVLLKYRESNSFDKYGYGAVMRLPLKLIKNDDLKKINEYIDEVK